jgi:hypothetical protein
MALVAPWPHAVGALRSPTTVLDRPPGFAYEIDVALPPPPPPFGPCSYADMTTNCRQGLRRNTLSLGNALRAGFVSSSDEEGAVPRL